MDYPIALPAQLKQHLRSLRKARGLTQSGLAQLLGVVQSRVADIEANPGAVSVDQLLQILGALKAQVLIRDTRPAPDAEAVPNAGSARKKASSTPPRGKSDPPHGEW